MAEGVAFAVLRHRCTKVRAQPQVAEHLAEAIEARRREALQHHDAAAVHQFAAHVVHNGSKPR